MTSVLTVQIAVLIGYLPQPSPPPRCTYMCAKINKAAKTEDQRFGASGLQWPFLLATWASAGCGPWHGYLGELLGGRRAAEAAAGDLWPRAAPWTQFGDHLFAGVQRYDLDRRVKISNFLCIPLEQSNMSPSIVALPA